MAYPFIRQGDKYPAVGVLQKLLNRAGARLDPDGDFGPKTKQAVWTFQNQRRMMADGVVGEQTWPRLSVNANLPIVDCVDVFDPSLQELEVEDIRRAGGNPIVIGGMSNGIEQMINAIVRQARDVFILRFHGHGAPGGAAFSSGDWELDPRGDNRATLTLRNLATMRPVIRRLRSVFGPYGCIQFMHCSTGRGQRGRQLLQAIADETGVPVTAAIYDQLGGGVTTFRYEGPTFTALPSGTLKEWCRSRPDFAPFMPS
jgi:hypothetical protein